MSSTPKPAALSIMLLDPQGDFISWSNKVVKTGKNWDIFRLDDADTLLSRLKVSQYDAIFLASSMKSYAEHDLLRKAMALQKNCLRFQLGAPASSSLTTTVKLELTHRIFNDPNDIELITHTTEYLLKINRLIRKVQQKYLVSEKHLLPASPQVYNQLSIELNSDSTNAKQVALIIEQDPALAAKVIQIVNSAFFGLERPISHIGEAVAIIGTRMLRGLALSSQISQLYPAHKNWRYFSFDKINQRSVLVARLARDICKDVGVEKGYMEQAFLAGLLHDIGILIMASRDPAKYLEVMRFAVEKGISLHAAEKEKVGFYHGEVGAALMAAWNIPPLTVEAILFHPAPSLSSDTEFRPLTALHVADALLPPAWSKNSTSMNSSLSESYLAKIDHLKDLHRWKLMANQYKQLLQKAA